MSRNFVSMDVNPCKMCMAMGASLAFKGLEGAMILMHGSQGCSTYIRRHISTHFDEPIDIASSSLNEKDTIHGGAKNLKHGLKNVIALYDPKAIGVLTTCLTETIGEDTAAIVDDFKKKHGIRDIDIIPVSTPGYGGSHYEGYYAAVLSIVKYFARPAESHEGINIITGWMTPAEVRDLKRILSYFDINATIVPDISETLDEPYSGEYHMIPAGGTKAAELSAMAGARATIEFGLSLPPALSPGAWLEAQYGVPLYRLPLPIGLKNTDALLAALCKIARCELPEVLQAERGRLLDAMIDSHKFNAEGNAALFGDPETVYATAALCLENGIEPIVVATGTRNDSFEEGIRGLTGFPPKAHVLADTDFDTIQTLVRANGVNLLIGHSDGKFVEEKENVPLVRIGFPIHDRVGAHRQMHIGYGGTALLLDRIANMLIEAKHSGFRQELFDTFYRKTEVRGA